MNVKKISLILAIIVAIITISTTVFKLDGRWAKSEYVKIVESKVVLIKNEINKVELRLEQKILQDDVRQSTNKESGIWKVDMELLIKCLLR